MSNNDVIKFRIPKELRSEFFACVGERERSAVLRKLVERYLRQKAALQRQKGRSA